jgi:hypothetical protein
MTMKRATVFFVWVTVIFGASNARLLGEVFDFEDLGLPADSFHNGHPEGPNRTTPQSTTFGDYPREWTNGTGTILENEFSVVDFGGGTPGIVWQGFALSSKTDTDTPGFPNQYSAFPGGGANGSSTYGVAFLGADADTNQGTIRFQQPTRLSGTHLTNTTYAYRAIVDGNTGGAFDPQPFDTGDFFLLSITGRDTAGLSTGEIEFYLADYRTADTTQHFAVADWQWVDLSSLGTVAKLDFAVASSDVSDFGGVLFLNTPAYFAIDDLTLVESTPTPTPAPTGIPEPATLLLGGLAVLILCAFRVRRKPVD